MYVFEPADLVICSEKPIINVFIFIYKYIYKILTATEYSFILRTTCSLHASSCIGKFLPMKTMLGPRYDDQVPEENRFHPSMLSNYLKSLKVSNCVKTEVLINILKLNTPKLTCHFYLLSGENGFACRLDEHYSLLWPQRHRKRRRQIREASV